MGTVVDTLQLSGFRISKGNLDALNGANFPNLPDDLIAEIKAFLQTWWNDKDAIQVKTSGSTGEPKTISLSKSSIIASADKTIAHFGLAANDLALLCLPVRYIAGKLMIVRAMRANLNLIAVAPTLSPLEHVDQSFKFAAMVPAQVAVGLSAAGGRDRLERIDHLLIGGGPIAPDLEKQLMQSSINAYHSYGMTETATHVALRQIGKDTAYTALNGVAFEKDTRDCLVITADHISEKITTNDVVELIDAQHFRWLGRADHVINSGGVKHFPEQIEERIAGLIERPFFITGEADPVLGERLVLVIEDNPWSPSEVNALKTGLEALLEKNEAPKRIAFREAFARTATGKIRRRL